MLGAAEGTDVGAVVGNAVGATDGLCVGDSVGDADGTDVEGAAVGGVKQASVSTVFRIVDADTA